MFDYVQIATPVFFPTWHCSLTCLHITTSPLSLPANYFYTPIVNTNSCSVKGSAIMESACICASRFSYIMVAIPHTGGSDQTTVGKSNIAMNAQALNPLNYNYPQL